MATIKPFKAIRPNEEVAHKVAALPYDVMNSKEAKLIANNNPYSFLHIDKSEIDLEDNINEYDEKVYLKARENLDRFRKEEILIKEESDCFYIYKQVMNDRPQTGIVACVSVEESLNGVIKKHEYTKPDKEKDRTNHIRYCNANTGTILVTYKAKETINNIINKYIVEHNPLYDFTTEDDIQHTIWKVGEEQIVNNLVKEFESIPYLYIADGHHRSASAENIAKEKKKENINYTGDEEFNYYTAMIAPDKELMILDYNRVIKDLNGLTEEKFIEKIKENFAVRQIKEENYKPNAKGKIGMYLKNQWYEIEVDESKRDKEDVVKSLDISILQDNIITPILGITNPKSDKRIDFVGATK
ncbi:DUF1015 domain-containing protein [Romboutsia sp.]|uniref:DUF1015 domain-containing protein n=1 Tax=Romboutsia sp. TaxID=1965302 RepID=UPI003F41B503